MKNKYIHILATATAVSMLGTSIAVTPANAGPDDGKIIATEAHVDAPKTFFNYETNTFELKNEFQRNNYPLEETAVWIGKGWSGGGNNQYQFPVTDDELLDFLGNDGDVLYASPAYTSGGHYPIWLGFGADADIPADEFIDGTISLDILEAEGPGYVEMFSYTNAPGWKNLKRLLSSEDPGLRSARLDVGQHTHNWTTFSQPGRYVLTYRAVARDLEGNLVSSGPRKLAIQVGGLKPLDEETPSLRERYDAATSGDASQQNYRLRVSPKSEPSQDGDENLSTITFTSGDEAINGTLTLLNHGHFLTDIEVKDGVASHDELLGAGNASIQAVFTPEGDAPRWISEPITVARGESATTTSARSAEAWQDPIKLEENTPFPQDVYKPTELGVTVRMAADPNDENYTIATVEFDDKKIRGFIDGGLYENADDDWEEYPLEGNIVDGKATIRFADDGDFTDYTPKFTFYPHPDVLVSSGTIIPGTWNNGSLTYSTTLEASPIQVQPAETSEQSTPVAGKHLLDQGHVDIAVHREGDKFVTKLLDDSNIVARGRQFHDLDDIALVAGPNAKQDRIAFLADERFDFLGPIGEEFFYLPQNQIADVIWPGYNTQELDYSDFTEDGVRLVLKPKNVPEGATWGAFIADSFWRMNVIMDSTIGDYTIHSDYASHVHINWGFSHPGLYEFDLTYEATLKDGTPISSDADTLTFIFHDGEGPEVHLTQQPASESEPTEEPAAEAEAPSQDDDSTDTDDGADDSQPAIVVSRQGDKFVTTLRGGTEPATYRSSEEAYVPRTGEWANDKYSFMGPVGERFYLLPQDDEQLAPGYDTTALNYADFANEEVELLLTPQSVPEGSTWGVFTDEEEDNVLLDSRDGNSITTTSAGAKDLNWAFSKPGTYEFEVAYTATLPDGTTITSDPETLTFVLEDVPGDDAEGESNNVDEAPGQSESDTPASDDEASTPGDTDSEDKTSESGATGSDQSNTGQTSDRRRNGGRIYPPGQWGGSGQSEVKEKEPSTDQEPEDQDDTQTSKQPQTPKDPQVVDDPAGDDDTTAPDETRPGSSVSEDVITLVAIIVGAIVGVLMSVPLVNAVVQFFKNLRG